MKKILSLTALLLSLLALTSAPLNQHLYMPLMLRPVLPTPTPSPAPATSTLVYVPPTMSDYPEGGGAPYHYFVGEIQNDSPQGIEAVGLRLHWYDAAGALLRSHSVAIYPPRIAAGSRTCFVVGVYEPDIEGWQRYEADAPTYRVAARPLLSLTPTDLEGDLLAFDLYQITGSLHNPYPHPLENVLMGASLYDEGGRVYDCWQIFSVPETVEAGQSLPFEMRFGQRINYLDAASFDVRAAGHAP